MKVDGWLEKAQYENLAGAPTPASTGRVYCDITAPTAAVPYMYNGTKWIPLANVVGIQSKTAGYTALLTDSLIICDATSASFAVALPTAVGNAGYIVTIRKKLPLAIANVITLTTVGGQTIDGRASGDVTLSALNDYVTVCSDGANYIILAKKETKYVTATSTTFSTTSITGSTYLGLTGNSVSLGIGQWRLSGRFLLFSNGSSNYIDLGAGFYAANGANSATVPTALTGIIGLNKNFVDTSSSVGVGGAGGEVNMMEVSCDLVLTATTTVFLVPILNNAATGGGITVQISAVRVW